MANYMGKASIKIEREGTGNMRGRVETNGTGKGRFRRANIKGENHILT